MKNYKIAIEKDNKIYSIFTIGYDKNGGYFVKDLSITNKLYFVTKIKFRLSGIGNQLVPINHNQKWITRYKPKLMHHIDGSTHISGTGIRSGFFKSIKKSKGVQTVSPNFNDGGPIFSFLCWGLEKFDTSKKNRIVFKNRHIIPHHPLLENYGKFKGYTFEGFYLPYKAMTFIDLVDDIIPFKHPNLRIIQLKYIPSPINSPGIIAISCRESLHDFDADHGFSYGGGVTFPDEDGYNTQIQIIYPFEEEFKKTFESKFRPKSLHFNFKHRLIYWFDDFISSIFKSLIKKNKN